VLPGSSGFVTGSRLHCEKPRWPIDHRSGSPVQHLAPALLVGRHNPNELANCFSLGKALRSAPASAIKIGQWAKAFTQLTTFRMTTCCGVLSGPPALGITRGFHVNP
jgi:hypothetical protein